MIETDYGNAYEMSRGYLAISNGVHSRKLLHRVIYEEYYKVCLLDSTVIHHIDGDKSNNDISNLIAMTFEEHCQLHHKGKINSLENKVSLSLSQNTTSYFRVIKVKSPQCKQGFHWRYQWRDGDKRHCLSSVNIDKLKEKVLAKGLEWIEFDEVNHEVN